MASVPACPSAFAVLALELGVAHSLGPRTLPRLQAFDSFQHNLSVEHISPLGSLTLAKSRRSESPPGHHPGHLAALGRPRGRRHVRDARRASALSADCDRSAGAPITRPAAAVD